MTRCLILTLLMAAFSLKTSAQENTYQDPYRLIEIVVQKTKDNDEMKKKHLQFTKRELVSDLNKIKPDGKPTVTKEVPPSRRGVGLEKEEVKLNVNDLLVDRYEFRFIRPFPHYSFDAGGRKLYEVGFIPKPGLPRNGKDIIKVANRLRGTLYIDAEHLYVTKVSAEMPETEAFSTHVFGEVKWVQLEVYQSHRPELKGLVVIDYVKSLVKYKILWIVIPRNYFEQYEYFYSDYSYVH